MSEGLKPTTMAIQAFPDESSSLAPGTFANAFRVYFDTENFTIFWFQVPANSSELPSVKERIQGVLEGSVSRPHIELQVSLPAASKVVIPAIMVEQVANVLRTEIENWKRTWKKE